MISYLICVASNFPTNWINYVIMAFEFLVILIKFLQMLVPESSKFGQFLKKLLPAIKFLKTSTTEKRSTVNKEEISNVSEDKKDEEKQD